MPLQIIRQDIVKINCDAVVNPTNTSLLPTGGTDAAIHKAAGSGLLSECRSIGFTDYGKAIITRGYNLPAKHVIHTAAPLYDGNDTSVKILRACYKSCLDTAMEHNLKSVAFPLIGAGTQGFPNDLVLRVALSCIGEFLLSHELLVTLAVFNKDAFILSEKLFPNIEEFIDDNYVKRKHTEETSYSRALVQSFPCAPMARARGRKKPPKREKETFTPLDSMCAEEDFSVLEDHLHLDERVSMKRLHHKEDFSDLENYLHLDESFSLKLLRLIDAKGISEVECYKKANVSKQTWYKIMNDKEYRPNKKTVLSFAISLELSLEETQTLLNSVGFVLSESSLFDVIIMYCLNRKIYDIFQIDSVLFKYDQETLFSKA